VRALFAFFLTWWGAFLLGALDASLLFFLPFGIDTVVIYLAASNESLFWLYPVMATAGSLAGAGVTFAIGHRIGGKGLEKLVDRRRLARIQSRVRDRGAIAMAVPALLPPPFPLTPFILTCGALDVSRWRFFATFACARLVRFGLEAVLARTYGSRIVGVLQSDAFRVVIVMFIVVAIAGTVVSAVVVWRKARR
jgi:membrane protein YqaA with SNARE-associated domain